MGSCRSLTAAYSNNQQQYSIIINNKKAPTDLSIFYSPSDIACSESVKIHHPNKNPKSPPSLFQTSFHLFLPMLPQLPSSQA